MSGGAADGRDVDAAGAVAAEVLALLTSERAAPVRVRGEQTDTVVFASDVRAAVRRGLRAARAVDDARPGRLRRDR